MEPPDNKTHVMFTQRRVATKWVSCRTLQQSTELVVTNVYVPSDFLVKVQDSGLGNVHPLLALNFFSTWYSSFLEEDVVIHNGCTPAGNVLSSLNRTIYHTIINSHCITHNSFADYIQLHIYVPPNNKLKLLSAVGWPLKTYQM